MLTLNNNTQEPEFPSIPSPVLFPSRSKIPAFQLAPACRLSPGYPPNSFRLSTNVRQTSAGGKPEAIQWTIRRTYGGYQGRHLRTFRGYRADIWQTSGDIQRTSADIWRSSGASNWKAGNHKEIR